MTDTRGFDHTQNAIRLSEDGVPVLPGRSAAEGGCEGPEALGQAGGGSPLQIYTC